MKLIMMEIFPKCCIFIIIGVLLLNSHRTQDWPSCSESLPSFPSPSSSTLGLSNPNLPRDPLVLILCKTKINPLLPSYNLLLRSLVLSILHHLLLNPQIIINPIINHKIKKKTIGIYFILFIYLLKILSMASSKIGRYAECRWVPSRTYSGRNFSWSSVNSRCSKSRK